MAIIDVLLFAVSGRSPNKSPAGHYQFYGNRNYVGVICRLETLPGVLDKLLL